jgi:hypothetical protein
LSRFARISRPSAFRCRPGGGERQQRRPFRAVRDACRPRRDARRRTKAGARCSTLLRLSKALTNAVAESRTSSREWGTFAGYGLFESSTWGDEPGEARKPECSGYGRRRCASAAVFRAL